MYRTFKNPHPGTGTNEYRTSEFRGLGDALSVFRRRVNTAI